MDDSIGGNVVGDASYGVAKVGSSYVVGERRGAVFFDAHKVGISSLGKLRRHAEADVVFVEVKVDSVGEAKIAEVFVVLEVVSDRKVCRDIGSIEIGGENFAAVLIAGGMGREGLALDDVALPESGNHASYRTGGIGGIRVTVGPVNRIAIADPPEDG